MNRRGFIGGIFAAAAAPAIVRAESIMRLRVPRHGIITPDNTSVWLVAWGEESIHELRQYTATDVFKAQQGRRDRIIQLLNESNELLADIPWVENTKSVMRTGLPKPYWRTLTGRS